MNEPTFRGLPAQVMSIYGVRQDPTFPTALHAIARGASPGGMDAVEQVAAYELIVGTFASMEKAMNQVRKHLNGRPIYPDLREEMYKTVVEAWNEEVYGGEWFDAPPSQHDYWVNLGAYSPIFRRANQEFYLPSPYFPFISEVFEDYAHYRDSNARCYNCTQFEDPSTCSLGVNGGIVEPEGGCDKFEMYDDANEST